MPLSKLDDRTALVTIDLQNAMVAMPTVHPIADVLAQAVRLSEAFRTRSLPVIHTRLSFAPDFGDAFAPRAQRPLPNVNPGPGWDEAAEALEVHPTDLKVVKHQWSAFHGTDLDVQLRRRQIAGIVLSGLATSIGVESTARAAMDHGYNVTIAEDAVTDLNPVAHANSLEHIFPLFAQIAPTEAIVSHLS
jgi:nicotinamidase-related amidase